MEYPQIRKFAGGGYVNQENFIRPAMHFGEIVKQYGWVFPSKDLALHVAHPNCKTANVNKRTVDCLMQSPFKFSAKCCAVLKKDVANKYCKEHRAITFVGIKAAESATRFFTWQRNGCNMTKGKTKSFRPLMIFNDNDVLTYIKKYNLTLCEIYGDIIETGKAQKRGIIKPVGETKIAKSFKPSPSCKNYYEWTEQETVPVYKTTGLPRTGCCCCPCSDYTEMQLDKQFAPRMYEYVMSLGLRDIIDYCKANDICRNKWS
jgi:3'-phosphoadenosine 5'-phosphosulfate sulfotransferase (PAPS reductase)/FAD synthetase